MESNPKSKFSLFQTSESILFFQGPPLKHWSSDSTSERAKIAGTFSIAEIERKTRANFPELFYLRDQETYCTEQGALRSITPLDYPSDISYKFQHAILVTAQNILENCCYQFARQWFPFEFENAGWDCAEAVELTKWTKIITECLGKLPDDAFVMGGSLSQDILASVHLLRHTAVHRLRTTARGVSRLIQRALKFTAILQDSARTMQLEELHDKIEAKIKDIEYNEYALDRGITAMLQNELDGIVPQGNDCSLEEEITALFEALPIGFVPKQEIGDYSSDEDD
jgi:hypothetical protein